MNNHSPSERPLVSVILATYNEARHAKDCLGSLQNQETPDFELEILVVDGMSTDGTKEIAEQIAATDPRVRVLANKKRKTPFAFNIGLRESRGKYVCIFGGHTFYKPDYIAVCLREMVLHGAVGCVGRILTQPSSSTFQARLTAWAVSHPFGSSRKSFRTQPEGDADTINYPILLKAPLLEVGGYDEELTRNQDNDMVQKLRARGYKLYCTWKTQCFYYPKATFKDLVKSAFKSGFWNVISMRKNPEAMAARHFVPFLFLVSLLTCITLGISDAFLPNPHPWVFEVLMSGLLGAHLFVGTLAAMQVAFREKSLAALGLPLVFLAFHLSYGFGTLSALASRASASSPRQDPKEAADWSAQLKTTHQSRT